MENALKEVAEAAPFTHESTNKDDGEMACHGKAHDVDANGFDAMAVNLYPKRQRQLTTKAPLDKVESLQRSRKAMFNKPSKLKAIELMMDRGARSGVKEKTRLEGASTTIEEKAGAI